MKKKLLFLLFMTVGLMVGSATAMDIPVPNASFEESDIPDGSWEYVNDASLPWICSASGSGSSWTARNYVQGYGYPQVGHDGPTYTEMNGDYVYQTLTAKYVEGIEYTLSVWCATHFGSTGEIYGYFTDGVDFTEASALYNSGAQVVPTSPDNGPLSHIWYQYVFNYTATAADAGKNIGIMFWGGGDTNMDDVVLSDSTTLPYPPARNPSPDDGAPPPLVFVDTDLSWGPPENVIPTGYDLWFGDPNTLNPLGWVKKLDNQLQTTWDPPNGPGSGDLANNTTYYWRVDTHDPNDGVPSLNFGDLWSFTTVPPAPFILTQPEDQTVAATATAILTIEQTQGLTYEWFYSVDANNLSPGDDTSLATGDCSGSTVTLVLDDVQLADEGYYFCVVRNNVPSDANEVSSETAWLMTERLVGHWKLDDGNGTTAADSSGNSNTGTVHGSATPAWITGIDGGALSFDGVDEDVVDSLLTDYVDCGSNESLKPSTGVTVSAWYKTDTYRYYGQIAGFMFDSGSSESGYSILTTTGGWIGFWITGSGSGAYLFTSDVPAEPMGSEWAYVVGTYDGTTMRLYVNGVEKASSTANSGNIDYDYVNSFKIGLYESGTWWQPYEGDIDDVRVYNYARTSSEVLLDYGKPVITEQPQELIIGAGETAQFTVSAIGAPVLTYEWFHNSVSVPSGGKYSGEDSNTLTITDVQSAEAGMYYCEVTNSNDTVTSDTVMLSTEPLIGHWKLDESTGTTAYDSGLFGYDGTLQGGFTFDANSVAGIVGTGTALEFDGDDDYVEIPQIVQRNFTLAAWIKTSTPGPGNSGDMAYWGDGLIWSDVAGVANDFILAVVGTKLSFFCGNPDVSVNSETDVVTGEWVHVVATRSAQQGTIGIYINGEHENTVDYANNDPLNALATIAIGGNTGDSRFYTGHIDDVRVYGVALDKYEIATLYTDTAGGWICTDPPSYDKNGDCVVGLDDFAAIAAKWMDCNRYPQSGCP